MKKSTIIVAHPDDETLWAGGTILSHPEWNWKIFTLTRRGDPDRSSKFEKALSYFGASGGMNDLNDDPDQPPLDPARVKKAVLELIKETPGREIVITHGPKGEYTRHLRHEEVSSAVTEMWIAREIESNQLWLFAYEDGNGDYLPRPEKGAELFSLPREVWARKRHLVRKIYGFDSDSWESRANPRIEGFWKFKSRENLKNWLNGGGYDEDPGAI